MSSHVIQRVTTPRFLIFKISYDVASNTCPALDGGVAFGDWMPVGGGADGDSDEDFVSLVGGGIWDRRNGPIPPGVGRAVGRGVIQITHSSDVESSPPPVAPVPGCMSN